MCSRNSSWISQRVTGITQQLSISSHKTEIEREMLSGYQLKSADHYNFPIDNVKKLVPNYFHKEKYVKIYNLTQD